MRYGAISIRQQFQSDLDAVVYFPYRMNPGAANLLIRSESDPPAIDALIRGEISALDPDVTPYRFRPLAVWAGQSRALSAIGLYAVTSYVVTQRTQEIGVRVA